MKTAVGKLKRKILEIVGFCWAKRGRRNFDDFRSLVCFLGRSVCSAALYSLLFLVSQLFLNTFAVKVQDVEVPWNVLRT